MKQISLVAGIMGFSLGARARLVPVLGSLQGQEMYIYIASDGAGGRVRERRNRI